MEAKNDQCFRWSILNELTWRGIEEGPESLKQMEVQSQSNVTHNGIILMGDFAHEDLCA